MHIGTKNKPIITQTFTFQSTISRHNNNKWWLSTIDGSPSPADPASGA